MVMVAESVRCYALQIDDNGRVVGEYADDPGAEVDRLARVYQADHSADYRTALDAVLNDPRNQAVAKAYAAS